MRTRIPSLILAVAGSPFGRGPRRFTRGLCGVCSLIFGMTSLTLLAVVVPVVNSSFELPETKYVDIRIEGWQKPPKPDWYAETADIRWDQLTGLFLNTEFGSSDHIENCDGKQAMWLFAVPEVGLSQELDPATGRYQPGHGYVLSVGIIGLGGRMQEGVPLELSLFYRDSSSNRVTLAQTTVTNSESTFKDRNHFVTFKLSLPLIQSDEPWAGRAIGIGLLSTVNTNLQGGYWVLDQLSLVDTVVRLSGAFNADKLFELTVESAPGLEFGVSSTPDPGGESPLWTSLGVFKSPTGTFSITDPDPVSKRRFYRLDIVPVSL